MIFDVSVDYSTTIHLIGTRSNLQPDGALNFLPTRDDLKQRFGYTAILGVFAGMLIGFAVYLELLPGTAEGPSHIALRAFEILGLLLLLKAIAHPLAWFRRRVTFSLDEHGDLQIDSRNWRTRRKSIAKERIESIEFTAVPELVRRVPVRIDSSNPRAAVARFWLWSVVIRPVPCDDSPGNETLRFRVVATHEAPTARELPEEVVALCRWLQEATGVVLRPALQE